jgi:cytoskeletal protein CcmA (bactofilin family)
MKDFLKSLNKVVGSWISSLKSGTNPLRQPQQSEINTSLASLLDAKSVFMSNVKIQGQLHCDENLVIDGLYKGNITAKNSIVAVGPSGVVSADIVAKKVIVEGELIGDISAEDKVVLAASAKLTGNIKAAVVDLKNGARFKGIIEMEPQPAEIIDQQLDLESKAIAMEPS